MNIINANKKNSLNKLRKRWKVVYFPSNLNNKIKGLKEEGIVIVDGIIIHPHITRIIVTVVVDNLITSKLLKNKLICKLKS